MSSITVPSPAVDPDHPLVPVARGRRGTELIMLIFAFGLVAFAFANVGYSLAGRLSSSMAEYLGAFAVIIVGGMGSYPGALLAALVLGVIEVVGSYLAGAVIGSAFLFLLMLAVLLVRPRGLLGAGVRV